MPDSQLIPAAQYVRMSTEGQQYSLENQSAAIQKYAETHSFEIVRTYSDAAKSGVVLKHRRGLRQLLEDVVKGDAGYQAILVYDVSRWGRFQDTDEAAHYEFLCKSAGVPVHYCAETFANDGTLPSLMMKALKRTMAGEYSRELSVKTFAGHKRLTLLGFKAGGQPGYGLRRMLVSGSGSPKQELAPGERKSIATDRVILIPGPAHEVQTIRDIYRMFAFEMRSVCYIARKLNSDAVARPCSSKWGRDAIREILINPKYAGCAVFGRTTCKLHTPPVNLPKSEWIVKSDAFEPVVDAATFAAAQKVRDEQTLGTANEILLDDLRRLLTSEGRLSGSIIQKAADVASPSTYGRRFGSLTGAFKLIGYTYPRTLDLIANSGIRHIRMHEALIAQIAEAFQNDVAIIRLGKNRRSLLRLRGKLIVRIIVAQSKLVWKETRRWIVDTVDRERGFVTLLARLDNDNREFLDFHVFPRIDRAKKFNVALNDAWLIRGKRLNNLSEFCAVVGSCINDVAN